MSTVASYVAPRRPYDEQTHFELPIPYPTESTAANVNPSLDLVQRSVAQQPRDIVLTVRIPRSEGFHEGFVLTVVKTYSGDVQPGRQTSQSVWPRIPASLVRLVPAWNLPLSHQAALTASTQRQLAQWYTFYNHDAVLAFLAEHTSVASALLEARPRIFSYFPDAKITLEVVSDHDGRDEDQGLTAFIATKLEPHEALTRLDEFERGWWEGRDVMTQRKLSFDVEFP